MKIRNIVVITCVLWCIGILFNPSLWAVGFTAFVDKTQGTIEDQFELTFRVTDTRNASRPQFNAGQDFQVTYQGQASQFRTVNGKNSSHIDFRYALFPKRVGRLTIPPATVAIDGKNYQSQPIVLQVSEAANVPDQERPAFVKSFVSGPQAYPNQQVLYTFEFYVRSEINVTNLRFGKPEFSGLTVTEMESPDKVVRVLGGQAFDVYTVRRLLIPLKPGKITIDPATLSGEQVTQSSRRSFFGGKRTPFQMRSNPLVLEVLNFPTAGRPANFYGLVGNHQIEAKISQTALKAGDSTTLTIVHLGTGEPESFQKPTIPVPASLKVYEDQPSFLSEVQGEQQLGQATFTSALVPSESGTIDFPPLEISFFNPQTRQYQTRTVAIPSLQVSPGEKQELTTVGGQSQGGQKFKVERLAEDLLPIHTDLEALDNTQFDARKASIHLVLFLVSPLLFLLGWGWRWKMGNSSTNEAKKRKQRALSEFQDELEKIGASKLGAKDFAHSIMAALKNYIGNKSNSSRDAMTRQEVEAWLLSNSISNELTQDVKSLLEVLQSLQYGAGVSNTENLEIINRSKELIKKYEKEVA